MNQKKILLIDDELDILEILSYNLEKEGYDIYTATNGNEGIDKAKEIVPDLILLDVMMPEKDGIETCQELRKIKELQKTLIVFLLQEAKNSLSWQAFRRVPMIIS